MSATDIQNKIFISFNFSVKDEVTEIKNQIEREVGLGSCWMCTTELLSGDPLHQKIVDGINHADVMICMINQKYIDSTICEKEFLSADRLGKRIIPVHLEKIQYPYKKSNLENSAIQLSEPNLVRLDLHKDDRGEALKTLFRDLKIIFKQDRRASGNAQKSNQKSSYMTKEVEEDTLAEVAEKLGSNWRQFTLKMLKLKKAEIDICVHPNKDSLPDMAFNCLNKWKEREGLKATNGELARLLRTYGYGHEVWDKLESPPE